MKNIFLIFLMCLISSNVFAEDMYQLSLRDLAERLEEESQKNGDQYPTSIDQISQENREKFELYCGREVLGHIYLCEFNPDGYRLTVTKDNVETYIVSTGQNVSWFVKYPDMYNKKKPGLGQKLKSTINKVDRAIKSVTDIKYSPDEKMRLNDNLAQSTLKSIASAAETYFTTNKKYPSSMHDLTNATPPYLRTNYCEDESKKGYHGFHYSCDMSESSYKFIATPVELWETGSQVFIQENNRE